ncbi:hypothetical protein JHK85_041401 [Glycine max]|nr:hypothetical protein JHK85_041401 [Glycine max]
MHICCKTTITTETQEPFSTRVAQDTSETRDVKVAKTATVNIELDDITIRRSPSHQSLRLTMYWTWILFNLQWILHDWNDKECVDILKKCKEAITRKGKEGKVIIIDMVVEDEKRDDESVETQLFFDMQMMVLVTGKERSKKEWTKLISSAGYNNYKITPVFGLRSLIEIYP